jgi:hypothetical protein
VSPKEPYQPSLVYVLRVAFAVRLWLFGLPGLPPVGGGEHLPALLPDLRHFRLLRYWHRLAHRRDAGLSQNVVVSKKQYEQ